jgi:glycosyltransferase involved in cell wall biosynthesis
MAPRYDYFVAAHVTEIYGPVQALRNDLAARKKNFAFAACPFGYAKIPVATTTLYTGGEAAEVIRGHANRGRGFRQWLADARFVSRQAQQWSGPQTIFVGIDALNAAVGIRLRRRGVCRRVVYYVIDYTPRRFKFWPLNWLYQYLCRYAARHADAVWNLSERMRPVHRKFGTPETRNLLVPVGVDLPAVKLPAEKDIDRRRLVVVSALFENKGVQLAIDALRRLPQARLAIVGTGPYESVLRERARQQGVAERVDFFGLMQHEPLFRFLPTCGVALAPYQPDPANYTYYADPTKPKEYLACGVPVVITRVPWIAEVIEHRPMGVAIAYDEAQLADACRRLLEDDAFWRRCRTQALAYARELDWSAIYTTAWEQTAAVTGGDRDEP